MDDYTLRYDNTQQCYLITFYNRKIKSITKMHNISGSHFIRRKWKHD